MDQIGFDAFGFLIVLAVVGLYFLPTIVAASRNHPNRSGILIVNFFLGWTLLGWVLALVWSVYRKQ